MLTGAYDLRCTTPPELRAQRVAPCRAGELRGPSAVRPWPVNGREKVEWRPHLWRKATVTTEVLDKTAQERRKVRGYICFPQETAVYFAVNSQECAVTKDRHSTLQTTGLRLHSDQL
ncbi:hypothetical protein NDU88_003535 [Pleurodeles waltl]|uniref:Uncharacterized protein n=1 Tax=Pleurodeles waltl TaxID=8319 RepID=A0AAV7P9X0_PLEWA|nr:hypothetical protein NDU88_003535 [Pleurodeles waltl]